jgi:transposase-like protein
MRRVESLLGCRQSPTRHEFPPVIIQHAVWLYLRIALSYRDAEDLLAECGLEGSYETVRRWVLKFGPAVARRLRQRRPKPSPRWHLDAMAILSAKSGSRQSGPNHVRPS